MENPYLRLIMMPGFSVPVSGQYAEFDSQNQKTGDEFEFDIGEKFPPAPSGHTFKLVIATS